MFDYSNYLYLDHFEVNFIVVQERHNDKRGVSLKEEANTLYKRISTLCAQRGITPSKLCSEIGLSRGILSDLKAGRKKELYATTAYKSAKYFGVSVGYLLGYEDK